MDEEEMDEEETSIDIEDRTLLANLEQCHENCLDGVMHSLDEGGDYMRKDHIRWLLDCAEICNVAENFVIRESEYAGDFLSICAFICDDCAEACETFFEDENMKNCALVCRNCANACRDSIEEEESEETKEDKTKEDK